MTLTITPPVEGAVGWTAALSTIFSNIQSAVNGLKHSLVYSAGSGITAGNTGALSWTPGFAIFFYSGNSSSSAESGVGFAIGSGSNNYLDICLNAGGIDYTTGRILVGGGTVFTCNAFSAGGGVGFTLSSGSATLNNVYIIVIEA